MSDTFKRSAGLSREEKRALLAELLRKKAEESGESRDWSPLSHGQRALWFLYRLAPESPAYNLLYAAHVRSTLDIPSLQRAVQALLERHPLLSAIYTMQDGEPVQHFHPDHKLHVEVIDASSWSREQLNQRLLEEGDHPFDLERGPVLRIKVFQRTAQNDLLSLTVHHIAVDFWSLDMLINELCLLYAAERGGLPAPLPAPVLHYPDFVRWQADMLASSAGEGHWTYWQQQLQGPLPMLNLPLDRPRPAVQNYRGASHTFELGEELFQQLKALASAAKTTLYTLLLAAFELLLYRYTDQDDLLIGTTALGRSRAELEKIVGYLANPVVLRTSLSGNPTFQELLGRVRQTVIGALDHQDYPFPLLVERLQPRRDASYSPLFQTFFVFEKPRDPWEQDPSLSEPIQSAIQERLRLEPFIYGQQGAPFDLTLRMIEVNDLLSADLRYNVDLFEAATMARMQQHFLTLLQGIVADPGQRIADMPILSQAEQRQLLAWNDTQREYPDRVCVHQLIEQQVHRTPEAPAVVFEDQQLTYREVNCRANQLAHALQARGVGPEVLVGVCLERSLDLVVALLAILKAGGAYVPLDPTYPAERLAYMIQDAQLPLVLTQERLRDRLPQEGRQLFCLDSDWQASASWPEEDPVSSVQPDNLAYMIYTSGSTGRPKGVMNIHRGLCNRLFWMQQTYQLTPADRVLQKTPFSFDVSVWEFFWPLLTGACLVVARPGGHQDPAYLAALIEAEQITTLHFVPSMLQQFLLEPGLEERGQSLQRVICSGEVLPLELQARFFARLGAELHNLYGPTEASIDVTFWQCRPQSGEWSVPIGRPIANIQIYLLDRAGHLVPVGVPGELYIGGVGVARGYYQRPELTAEKFVPDPFSNEAGARLFRTADLARYRPDGAIEFLGRIDHQVKLRGFRIELGEIEAVLSQQPAIKEVVVLAREDAPGDKRLVAYLVSDQEPVPTYTELRRFLKEKLPDYMVPAAFVMLDALPLTANGKVDRRVLPEPGHITLELETPYVAPRTEVESAIVAIWKEVLHIEKVGVHDNFFDLGGHSLRMIQVHSALQERLKRDLPVIELFEYPTIDSLARYLSQGKSEQSSSQQTDGRVEKIKEGKNRLVQQFKQRQRAAKKGGT
jgi:amino acid adenylation domain-containing protein